MFEDDRPFVLRFFAPKITWLYLLRLVFVIGAAFWFFSYVCRPFVIDGASMMPTYPDHGYMLSWNVKYWFDTPEIGEIVIARVSDSTSYLKRVIALEGDTVQWVNGKFVRNGIALDEPYVVFPCNWNSEEITVESGYCYVVGDNRSMPRENHNHGQILTKRIMGVPLW